jgi:L-cysteine:1D-myo-inositol 2-amino-2-deoxy-alpha-D-glucopyranoside ligase
MVLDTATRASVLLDGTDQALLYVCGITPYDATHLGHAATYLAFDLLDRAWRDSGRAVSYVQNVTDIDDPLFERAAATGEDWASLAERQTELFRTDMAALRMIPPDEYVGAVEAIPLIVGLIETLDERDMVYRLDDDLYFTATASAGFGTVSGLDPPAMVKLFAEGGGDPDRPGKRNPLDCLLWTGAGPGEPSWESPWGPGRPGWHVECTAIAQAHLGPTVDVQGGGRDLVFPHHEMCAAQGRAVTGEPFARVYLHQGMVGLDGEKMSKSKGNLVLVSALRGDGTDPMAIRLALLAHHVRTDWDWTTGDLRDAEERLERWRLAARVGLGAAPDLAAPGAQRALTDVRAAMADHLDSPRALEVIDAWAAHAIAAQAAPGEAAGAAMVCDALLGVDLGVARRVAR